LRQPTWYKRMASTTLPQLQSNMFFTKAAVPALAIFGLATAVLANPLEASVSSVAAPTVPTGIPAGSAPAVPVLYRRDDVVLSAVQGVLANVSPLVAKLNAATSAVDVDAAVGAIVDLLANAKVDIAGLVGVSVAADVDAIVNVNVNLIVTLLAALSVKDVLDLSIAAKIDAALSAYLDALTKVKADIGVTIGHGIPAANLDVFGTLKLVLTGHVLDLVQVPGL